MKVVLFFGTFDPLHTGHKKAFVEARALGDSLMVVVARDSVIFEQKKHPPYQEEHERLAIVAAQHSVDSAVLGDISPSSYNLLKNTPFDILAIGYDQEVSLHEITSILEAHNKSHVRIVRLAAFQSHRYKSSILRPS